MSKPSIPFDLFRRKLYSREDLYDKYCLGKPESYKECYDYKVYKDYMEKGRSIVPVGEAMARTIHDRGISDSLHSFLSLYEERQIVGVMGGHSLARTDETYKNILLLSKKLSESGFILVTGGGPGAMEAVHLGAFLAYRSDSEVARALEILSKAPYYNDALWLDTAFEVIAAFPDRFAEEIGISLGVPTWFYGHEPAAPFASHIAKYFENSIREDGILSIAKGGIVYTPGSAGTLQEVFQDAVQNHYLLFGYSSPMIFLDRKFWCEEVPVYPLLEELVRRGKYKNLILEIYDAPEEIFDSLVAFRSGD